MSDVTEQASLLPCPFCGDQRAYHDAGWLHIECSECGATGPSVETRDRDLAAEAWNRRAALPASPAAPERETHPLALFGLAVLREMREDFGDLEGGWLQDKATELGVLTPVEVTEPCDPERCACAEYGEFPMTCYRDSAATTAFIARLADAGKEHTDG